MLLYKDKYKICNGRLYIPEGTINIPHKEFKGLQEIKEVYIPNSVVVINSLAFSCCFNLKKVVFEENSKCKYIFNNAFELCKNLSEINLPNSLEFIGKECFLLNQEIKNIYISKNIKEIGDYAFSNSNIKILIFGSKKHFNVTEDAFRAMRSLEKIFIENKEYETISRLEDYSVIPSSKRKLNDTIITSGYGISYLFTDTKTHYYICSTEDGKLGTLNTTLRAAFQELEDKKNLDIKKTAIEEGWDINTKINFRQYTAISKNCWIYTLKFMEAVGIGENDTVSIAEIARLSEGERNYDVFMDFVRKYVKRGDEI
jgi:hypothetical protein